MELKTDVLTTPSSIVAIKTLASDLLVSYLFVVLFNSHTATFPYQMEIRLCLRLHNIASASSASPNITPINNIFITSTSAKSKETLLAVYLCQL